MSETVTIDQKKEFLRWFLSRFELKRRECRWILSFVATNNNILKNLHFVSEAPGGVRSMTMSVNGTQSEAFRFQDGEVSNTDAEKAFHNLRMNPDKKVYLQLNFPNNTAIEYLSVLEDNPHSQKYSIKSTNDAVFVEDFIAHIMKLSETEKRNKLIDEALDTGNKAWFMELTSLVGSESVIN